MTNRKIKTAFTVDEGEKLCIVIAIGHGASQGTAHRSKHMEEVSEPIDPMPQWYRNGIEAALLAPTAMNQQRFCFALRKERVSVRAGREFYTKVDLGIVKYHFEIGAGQSGWTWDERA